MIQIDMPMPEACDVCPFNYDFCWCNAFSNNDEWEKYSDDWNAHVCDRETRPEYCPLKEQKAKNVINMTLSKDCFLIASCPKCNALLTRVEHKNYCGYCGQAVKWE